MSSYETGSCAIYQLSLLLNNRYDLTMAFEMYKYNWTLFWYLINCGFQIEVKHSKANATLVHGLYIIKKHSEMNLNEKENVSDMMPSFFIF